MSHRPPRGATGTRASGLLPWKRKGGPEAGQPRRLNRCPVCNHTKPLTASSEERSQLIEMTHFGKRLGPFPVPSSGHQSVHATSGLWQRKHSLLRKLLALRQGSANCSPGDHPGLLPVCVIKFYWHRAKHVHLRTVCGCSHRAVVAVKEWINHLTLKQLPPDFHRKRLLIPNLNNCSI